MIINDNELASRLEKQIHGLERIAHVAKSGAGRARSAESGIKECCELLRAIHDFRQVIKQCDDACNAAMASDSDRIEDASRVLEDCKRTADKSAANVARLLASWLTHFELLGPFDCEKSSDQPMFLISFIKQDDAKCVRLSNDRHSVFAEASCE